MYAPVLFVVDEPTSAPDVLWTATCTLPRAAPVDDAETMPAIRLPDDKEKFTPGTVEAPATAIGVPRVGSHERQTALSKALSM
jgi:hypothetical protein